MGAVPIPTGVIKISLLPSLRMGMFITTTPKPIPIKESDPSRLEEGLE
jgi:hypothetical protein